MKEKEVTGGGVYGELPVPTRANYHFEGWFTELAEGEIVSDSVADLTENQTLYAHWEEKYTVEMPTASIADATEVKSGTKVTLATATRGAKIYYTTDPEIGENVSDQNGILADDAITIQEPVTIYAVAIREDYNNSPVLVVSYTVLDETDDWGDIAEDDKLEMGFVTTADVPQGFWLTGVSEKEYCGKKITFSQMRVYWEKTLLVKGQDYTVKYTNNVNAGKATITITGMGNYSGSIVKNFMITPLDIGNGLAEDIVLTYNKKVQKGKTKVTYPLNGETVTLENGTDFTYTYPGTDSSAADYDATAFKVASETPYTVVIVGKGNYTGTLTFKQTIVEKTVLSKVTAQEISAQKYTGEAITPKVKLTYNKKKLVEGVDFAVAYSDNVEVGMATITVTGMGDFEGIKILRFKIKGTPLSQATYAGLAASVKYTGEPVVQEFAYFYIDKKSNKLEEGRDYTVEYQDNIEVGTATVIYIGKGGYTGTVKKIYRITGTSLEGAKVAAIGSQTFNGGKVKPVPTVTYEGTKLAGVEKLVYDTLTLEEQRLYAYVYSYKKNSNAGKATVKITGVNGYSGSLTKNFTIDAYNIKQSYAFGAEETAFANQKITVLLQPSYKYTKGSVTPKPVICFLTEEGYVELQENKDYTLTYSDNTKQGTATVKIIGKDNFTGTISETFMITGASLAEVTVKAKDVVYKKQADICNPVLTLTDANGEKLVAGKDYSKTIDYTYASDASVLQFTNRKKTKTKTVVRYRGNKVEADDIIPVGTEIKAVIKGKGNYKDSVTEVTFAYVKANIAKAKVTVSTQAYTGSAVEPDKADIKVTLGKTVLGKGDYIITGYRNNMAPGTGKVILRGVGNYGGTKSVEFKIKTKSVNYTIIYDKNASDVTGKMKNSSIPFGGKLAKNVYKKSGYTFTGWNTVPDGTGKEYTNGGRFRTDADKVIYGTKITLYAQWTPTVYKITYKLNGGKNHADNPKTYTIEDDKIVLGEPTRKGYEFLGWYTNSDFTSKKVTSIPAGSKGNKTLYAKWKVTVIEPVEVPDAYLNVLDFGAVPGDGKDDATAFEDAIKQASANAAEGGINTVYAPAGTYDIRPGDANNDGEPGICLKSNVNLVMDNKAVLKAMGSSYGSYCVISAKNANNITITGGKIAGERSRHKGSDGEAGHGIALFGTSNVTISNMAVSANWGDGIYLGTQKVRQADDSQKSVGCKEIDIINCEIYGNRRSNISVVDADDLLVNNCLIYDAHGTAPQCGINIEPNSDASGDKICRNITIKKTTITPYQKKTNDPAYMCFMTHYNPYVPNYVTGDNIVITDCVINGYFGNYSGTNLQLKNTTIKGPYVNLR